MKHSSKHIVAIAVIAVVSVTIVNAMETLSQVQKAPKSVTPATALTKEQSSLQSESRSIKNQSVLLKRGAENILMQFRKPLLDLLL